MFVVIARLAAALAAGYDLVFLMAAGLGLAIAVVSLLWPRQTFEQARTPNQTHDRGSTT